MKKSTNLSLTRLGGIALLTLDSPDPKINVITKQSLTELGRLVLRIERDPTIIAAIIISAKRDNFIAGADIREISEVKSEAEAVLICNEAQKVLNAIAASSKPYIAAIHGGCLGGGLELALACHFRIASGDAKTLFGFPEIGLALLPAAGGTQRLPQVVGLRNALDILLTGRKIDAEHAIKIGLLDLVVSLTEELYQKTIKFAAAAIANKERPRKIKTLSFYSIFPLFIAERSVRKRTIR